MTDTDADAAANAVYAAWDDAFNRADPKAIASLYAGEGLFLPATHDVIKGPAGIEAFFTALLKDQYPRPKSRRNRFTGPFNRSSTL